METKQIGRLRQRMAMAALSVAISGPAAGMALADLGGGRLAGPIHWGPGNGVAGYHVSGGGHKVAGFGGSGRGHAVAGYHGSGGGSPAVAFGINQNGRPVEVALAQLRGMGPQ